MSKRSTPLNISVFASGGGGNLKYLIENQHLEIFKILSVVTDRDCGASKLAIENGIKLLNYDVKSNLNNFDNLISDETLKSADLGVLAGFMPIVPEDFLIKFNKPMINTHPSLLPARGGKGMYGVNVQESVLRNKDKLAGCTCHFVDTGIDTGDIICQKSLEVDPNESAWELGGRVFILEGPNILNALKIIMTNKDNY